MKRWYAQFLLLALAGLNFLAIALLQGCAGKHQLKSYVSVEKAPMKVVYIDYSQDIDPDDVDRYIRAVSLVPFHDYQINDTSTVDVRYNVSASSDHKLARSINGSKD